jgi:hypothetical protein
MPSVQYQQPVLRHRSPPPLAYTCLRRERCERTAPPLQ